MRNVIAAVVVISLLSCVVSTTEAQCNRRSRGSTNRYGPNTVASSYPLPYAQQQALSANYNRNPYTTNLVGNQSALQSRLAEQLRGIESDSRPDPRDQVGYQSKGNWKKRDARRDRLRRQNAKQAFETAKAAEMRERYSSATRNYRKVIRIVGADDELGRKATTAIEEISDMRKQRVTSTVADSVVPISL